MKRFFSNRGQHCLLHFSCFPLTNEVLKKQVVSLVLCCIEEKYKFKLHYILFPKSIFEQVEDILFAAGEALSFLWGGVPVTTNMILKTNYTSLSMSSNFLMGEVSPSSSSRCLMDFDSNENHHITVRDSITRKLFDVLLYSNRKEERCAGTVWLLSLTVYCGHHSTIQQLLPDIQVFA